VFWHALGAEPSGADFGVVAPVLAGAGFHVLAVDGPGFGKSELLAPDDYRLGALAERLQSLIDERELDRPVLMGHSWGGAVAVRYAGAYPDDVRALVLLDSGHIDYADLPGIVADRTAEEWVAEARARLDSPNAEARGRAMFGLAERV